jgi:hypothetical protein
MLEHSDKDRQKITKLVHHNIQDLCDSIKRPNLQIMGEE